MGGLIFFGMPLSVLSVIGMVLLWILRILGWILLAVLILLVLVLIYPFRYCVKARYFLPGNPKYDPAVKSNSLSGENHTGSEENGETEDKRRVFRSIVRVKGMFSLVRVSVDFQDKNNSWKVMLGGKQIAGSEPPSQPSAEQMESSEPEAAQTETPDEHTSPPVPANVREETAQTVPSVQKIYQNVTEEVPEAEKVSEGDSETPAGTSPIDKAVDALDDLLDKIDEIPDKVDDFTEAAEAKIDHLESFLDDFDAFDDRDAALQAVLRMVRRIIREFLPKDTYTEVDWGTGDPYLTAQIMGVIEAIDPILNPKLSSRRIILSNPDLMHKNLEFSADMSGFFQLGGLLWPVAAALVNPHIWHLIHYIKNLKKQKVKA